MVTEATGKAGTVRERGENARAKGRPRGLTKVGRASREGAEDAVLEREQNQDTCQGG